MFEVVSWSEDLPTIGLKLFFIQVKKLLQVVKSNHQIFKQPKMNFTGLVDQFDVKHGILFALIKSE